MNKSVIVKGLAVVGVGLGGYHVYKYIRLRTDPDYAFIDPSAGINTPDDVRTYRRIMGTR